MKLKTPLAPFEGVRACKLVDALQGRFPERVQVTREQKAVARPGDCGRNVRRAPFIDWHFCCQQGGGHRPTRPSVEHGRAFYPLWVRLLQPGSHPSRYPNVPPVDPKFRTRAIVLFLCCCIILFLNKSAASQALRTLFWNHSVEYAVMVYGCAMLAGPSKDLLFRVPHQAVRVSQPAVGTTSLR